MKHCTKCGIEKAETLFPFRRCGIKRAAECKACISIRQRLYRENNSEKLKAKSAKHYLENIENYRLRNRQYQQDNVEAVKRRNKLYYEANKPALLERNKQWALLNLDAVRLSQRRYAAANRSRAACKASHRRTVLKLATPAWANFDLIDKLYALRDYMTKSTGRKHHVDHIIPLLGPLIHTLDEHSFLEVKDFVGPLFPAVQGLHCEANMTVIEGTENYRKSNFSWPDMPNYPFKQHKYLRR